MVVSIIFYSRQNCHLCDAMRKALVIFNRDVQPLKWQEIDIDGDARLVHLYNDKVPVLWSDNQEICHYFLDENALLSAL